ncbi:hypothetical protein SAMN06265371_110128 [Lutibacter agarilyticus]|uniref:Uncharacterized protein n=1 Tax=Lutibacter agarilyticus TaxID=1109740 RepID=A0A238YS30_9FLAO|nr:hypothetical protein [Lutibacter agarilyticus]SNR73830.1 hypothetical protein SAMN06265371_110128 [Lutibacter agarilyticus]
MKHFITLFLISFLIVGCNDNDDNDHDYHLEYTSVISAELPDEFVFGRTYRINVTIELPNSCYYFYNQYDYFYEGTSRLIYPIVHVDDGVACTQNIREITFTIPVQALQYEPYIFKFYQGEDPDGQDKFLTIEVPVI